MGMQSKLRWAIMGAARVNERLMPAIIEAKNAELIAIYSRRPGAAEETLHKYASNESGIQTYDDPDKLLANNNIDAVYLPMANEEHAEWALKVIAAGKHVLIEKPMALTVADIDAIEAAAIKHQVTVMEGFMYRFHPQHTYIRDLIASGVIGEVRTVRTCFSFPMKSARMYRLERDVTNGGGAMWDIGPYAIHTARMWFEDEPVSVITMAKYTESGADISTSGVIDYGDGRFAHFDMSFERARRSEYEIIGTLGGIKCHTVWQNPENSPVISWWTDDGQEVIVDDLPIADHFVLEIEHFSDCVLNGKSPDLSFADARSNCKIIVAAMQSATEGVNVKLN